MALCFICGLTIEDNRERWKAPTCGNCAGQGCPLGPDSEERCDGCDCRAPEEVEAVAEPEVAA